MRARRHFRRPPDLTSLFDVLFIVVFAALIRAAAVQRAAEPKPPPPPPAPAPAIPPAVAALRQRALADLDAALAARTPLVVRITRDGTIEALEVDGKRTPLIVPLVEHSPDPDVILGYAGDRSPELRICRIAARQLAAADLAHYLVIVAPAVAPRELWHGLLDGLQRDVNLCQFEQHAPAVLVDPTTLPPTPTQGAP
jgi:hypothetical protein